MARRTSKKSRVREALSKQFPNTNEAVRAESSFLDLQLTIFCVVFIPFLCVLFS